MDRNETVIRARSDGEIEPGDDSPQFVFNLHLCIRNAISRTTEPISTGVNCCGANRFHALARKAAQARKTTGSAVLFSKREETESSLEKNPRTSPVTLTTAFKCEVRASTI